MVGSGCVELRIKAFARPDGLRVIDSLPATHGLHPWAALCRSYGAVDRWIFVARKSATHNSAPKLGKLLNS